LQTRWSRYGRSRREHSCKCAIYLQN